MIPCHYHPHFTNHKPLVCLFLSQLPTNNISSLPPHLWSLIVSIPSRPWYNNNKTYPTRMALRAWPGCCHWIDMLADVIIINSLPHIRACSGWNVCTYKRRPYRTAIIILLFWMPSFVPRTYLHILPHAPTMMPKQMPWNGTYRVNYNIEGLLLLLPDVDDGVLHGDESIELRVHSLMHFCMIDWHVQQLLCVVVGGWNCV